MAEPEGEEDRVVLAVRLPGEDVSLDEAEALQVREMMPAAMIERAQIVGAALRVASVLSAGMPDVLPRASMLVENGKVAVTLPPQLADLAGERLDSRVKGVAKLLACTPATVVMPAS